MVARLKPEGEALTEFCRLWDTGDHDSKIRLAALYGVGYDTAKHWRCETPIVRVTAAPAPEPSAPSDEDQFLTDLLAAPYQVALDFVSFDLETSNLKADFSVVLTACIKPFGQDPIVFRADNYPFWAENRAADTPIVKDIAQELSKHAVVVTHYGTKFDLPYLRAKLLKGKLPNLPPMFAMDTLSIARGNFAVSSRRLKSLANYLNMGDKTQVEGNTWMEAAYSGKREAMDEIMEHNIQDCILLEKLASICFPYMKSIKRL